jgi:two-component system cell cycle response regulator DivK
MATVLVVEDNPANMTLATFLLKSAGYLVLMDIQLPGMDGLEACAILKKSEATRDIPVIALTALAMKGDEERIRAAGCDGYIAKPLAYREFLATIAARLQKTAV